MTTRLFAALFLSSLLAAGAFGQPKETEKKDPPPTKIDGKDVHEWTKMLHDKDPAVRHHAVATLGQFPALEVRRAAGKDLANKLQQGNEGDTTVLVNVIDLFGTLAGVEDPVDAKDSSKVKEEKEALNKVFKEAAKTLALRINSNSGPIRLHALQAIAGYGVNAHEHVGLITASNVLDDGSSYEIRVALARTLGHIAFTESSGPNPKALQALKTLAKSGSLPVRLEALQSFVFLGPAYKAGTVFNPKVNGIPVIDEDLRILYSTFFKERVGEVKAIDKETDKQAEMWCRLAIFRFAKIGDKPEREKEVTAIAEHLKPTDTTSNKLAAMQVLSIMASEMVAPLRIKVVALLNDQEPAVCLAAYHLLGVIGDDAIGILVERIRDPKLDTQYRTAAIDALGMVGDKATSLALDTLVAIIQKEKINDNDGLALINHAMTSLAAIGFKAKPAIADLKSLLAKVYEAKKTRLNSPEYQKMKQSPEFQKLLEKMSPQERSKFLNGEDTVEDQFGLIIMGTIKHLNEVKEPDAKPKK